MGILNIEGKLRSTQRTTALSLSLVYPSTPSKSSQVISTLSMSLVYKNTPSRRVPLIRGATLIGGITTKIQITGVARHWQNCTGRVSLVYPVGVIMNAPVRVRCAVFSINLPIAGKLRQTTFCKSVAVSFTSSAPLASTLRGPSGNLQGAAIRQFNPVTGVLVSNQQLQAGALSAVVQVTGTLRSSPYTQASIHFTGTLDLTTGKSIGIAVAFAELKSGLIGRCSVQAVVVQANLQARVVSLITGVSFSTTRAYSAITLTFTHGRRWHGQVIPPPPISWSDSKNRPPYDTHQELLSTSSVPNPARQAAREAAEEAARKFSETTH